MRLSELRRKVTEILPNCEIAVDNEGQLIIYTGLTPMIVTQAGGEHKIELKDFTPE